MVNTNFDSNKQDCIKSPLGGTIQAIRIFCHIKKEHMPKLTLQALTGFHRHFYNLCLILERIKEDNDKLMEERKEKKDPRESPDYYYFLLLDLETFLIYLRVIMDDIAGITPYFFGKDRGKMASSSFNDLKQWFIKKGSRFDPQFSKYLKDETVWFDEMKQEREAIIHYKANNIIFYCGDEIQYQNTWLLGPSKKTPLKPLIRTVRKYFKCFYKFCDFHDIHFIKRMKISSVPPSFIGGKYVYYLKWFLG